MTTRTQPLAHAIALALLLACAAPAVHADGLRPDGAFLEAGLAPHGTGRVAGGLVWDWGWRAERRALLSAQTELAVAAWRADAIGGGSQHLFQVVLLPVLRMQLDRGRSPWFLEFGIGASWQNRIYRTPNKDTSTRWNFHDMLGVGRRFGAQGAQELGLRYVHISNGGVRDPNGGEDFVQLRYGVRF